MSSKMTKVAKQKQSFVYMIRLDDTCKSLMQAKVMAMSGKFISTFEINSNVEASQKKARSEERCSCVCNDSECL